MKLEMSTDFLHLIEPGMYGTELGEALYDVEDEYIKDFKDAVVDYGIDKINEILSEESIVIFFGKCKAENGKLSSPRFYNYENDSIEFDLIVPDKTIDLIRNAEYNDEFFKWTKENYGSYDGFISFFPYSKEKFENALETNGLDLSRAVAMVIMKAFDQNFCEEEINKCQRDFENDVIEEVE
jgi:hypothetical protein